MIELSVVVPVYGCRDCLVALQERLTKTLGSITDAYEILYVDDRSPDDAWTVLQQIAGSDSKVKAVRLSRNFGQHAAITAGLALSRARWTVVMDCDLQDPPEEVARLYAKIREGYDLVLARRVERKQAPFRRLGARVYFKLLNLFLGTRLDGDFGTLSILSTKVRDAYLTLGEQDRHYVFILNWLGFNMGVIDVVHGDRFSGRSAYTMRRLVGHAIDGLLFQTTNLLIWIVYAGFALALGGVALAGFYVYVARTGTPPPGFSTVVVLLLVIGGFIIISTGVTGLYIGKVFQQVKGRPLYVIDTVDPGGTSRGAETRAREEVERHS